MTTMTGGYQSFLYWLYLGLIVRAAVSVPRATSQLAVNFALIGCYLVAGFINISIDQSQAEQRRADRAVSAAMHRAMNTNPARHSFPRGTGRLGGMAASLTNSPRAAGQTNAATAPAQPSRYAQEEEGSGTLSEPADSTGQPLLVRLVLLLLVTACSYGVQVLLERQRQAVEEASEFALREGQLRSAGRLAAEFAHQLKNPLAIINTAAFSLQRTLKEGRGDGAAQLEMIKEEVERADRIITDVMGYAQLSEGHVEKLEVGQELDLAIGRVFPPAAGYAIQVHRLFTLDCPPLLMVRRHASECFVNLLQNAREALGGKGNVWVGARCPDGQMIEISVQDDGPGIPAEKLERVFEAYYTTKAKGTGLGLATVKHNVELYGGRVRLESKLGKGARFVLSLPARTLPKAAEAI
jgi:signal transduction histidine kinase